MTEIEDKPESNLERHAKHELRLWLAAIDDPDSPETPYEQLIADAVMDLIRVFDGHEHSGMSASMTLAVFTEVANFRTLTPVTSAPDDWFPVEQVAGKDVMWQSKRNPALFSNDAGKTWWDVNDGQAEPKPKPQSVLSKSATKLRISEEAVQLAATKREDVEALIYGRAEPE